MQTPSSPTVIIIGGGIAGLSTGVYAQLNGYHSRIYEMHDQPGGLVTAWKRKGYSIDGCIHWLSFSSPKSKSYKLWEDIGLIQERKMFDPEIFSRIEGRGGQVLNLYSDIDRLEAELLRAGPEDAKIIHELCGAIRAFTRFDPPSDVNSLADLVKSAAKLPGMLVAMPLFTKWGRMSMGDLAERFQNPFLRETFQKLWYPSMSAMGLLFTFAMLHTKTAGYPIGGSLPMSRAVEKRYCDLGGEIFYKTRVEKILVENGRAVGVRLANGREERADAVISAADGHATIFEMLDGRFIDDSIRERYEKTEMFPPVVYIGLGVNEEIREPYGLTTGVSFYPDQPFEVAGQSIDRLEVTIYNFDPTLAPAGKTVMTLMFPTSYQYWKELHGEPERYEAEKQRVALEVIDRLGKRFPEIAGKVEMADVATPVTFERYTGNWQGSFEGWLPTPKDMMKGMSKTLPGLSDFYMAGQWVSPGGGLPSGVMTGRAVVQMLCKRDGKKFHN